MRSNLLSVGRYIHNKNPRIEIPQMSITSVSFKREQFEEIRKKKGISIRILEKKINLSKSRYYRWLNNQVDLPMELIVGMKKLLNLSDEELLQLFVSSTDEQLYLLNLIIYTSLSEKDEEFHIFMETMARLEKYRQAPEDNLAYKMILAYGDLLTNCLKNTSATKELESIETYFQGIDYFTLFDVQLYLAVLFLKQAFDFEPSVLEKEVLLLEKTILRNLQTVPDKTSGDLYIGCAVDLLCFYFDGGLYEQGKHSVLQVQNTLMETGLMTAYENELFRIIINTYVNGWGIEELQEEQQMLQTASWHIPECDRRFMEEMLQQEGKIYEKVDDKYC